jgi:Na+/melibiose symporter-like transporter
MTDLGLSEDISGYVVSVGAFFYMVFLHLMPAISKKLDKKMILSVGTVISILAMLVMAPEKYLGFPTGGNYWYFVTIGQCINGVGSAMVILPMIPELIELIVVNEMKRRKVA